MQYNFSFDIDRNIYFILIDSYIYFHHIIAIHLYIIRIYILMRKIIKF